MRTFLIALALLAFAAPAFAQSDPGLYNGQIPTAAQWNSYFAAKTDYPIQCATGSLYGNVSGVTGPLTCIPTASFTNVGSAYRWVTPRTISITGPITWTSPAFDGSANVSASAVITATGVTAATYGDSTHVAQVTVNAAGQVTGASAVSIASTSGTVTSVTCGTGLTGGTFTTTGTCALDLTRANTWTSLQTLSAGLTANGLATLSTGAVITPEATPATNEVGYLGTPENTQNATYALVMSDAGKLIYHTSGSAHTWTIPANASVAFPIGTVIILANESGGGNVTVAITSDTLEWTTSTGSRTLAANGTAAITKVGATTWRMTGDGIS